MEHALYDTGMNFLVAELRGGNPVRGLLVDRDCGTFAEDAESFRTNDVRMGSLRMGLMDTARLAARSRFVAVMRDGSVVECDAAAVEDPEVAEYVGVQPEGD